MFFKKESLLHQIKRKIEQLLVAFLCFHLAFPASLFAMERGDVLVEGPLLERHQHVATAHTREVVVEKLASQEQEKNDPISLKISTRSPQEVHFDLSIAGKKENITLKKGFRFHREFQEVFQEGQSAGFMGSLKGLGTFVCLWDGGFALFGATTKKRKPLSPFRNIQIETPGSVHLSNLRFEVLEAIAANVTFQGRISIKKGRIQATAKNDQDAWCRVESQSVVSVADFDLLKGRLINNGTLKGLITSIGIGSVSLNEGVNLQTMRSVSLKIKERGTFVSEGYIRWTSIEGEGHFINHNRIRNILGMRIRSFHNQTMKRIASRAQASSILGVHTGSLFNDEESSFDSIDMTIEGREGPSTSGLLVNKGEIRLLKSLEGKGTLKLKNAQGINQGTLFASEFSLENARYINHTELSAERISLSQSTLINAADAFVRQEDTENTEINTLDETSQIFNEGTIYTNSKHINENAFKSLAANNRGFWRHTGDLSSLTFGYETDPTVYHLNGKIHFKNGNFQKEITLVVTKGSSLHLENFTFSSDFTLQNHGTLILENSLRDSMRLENRGTVVFRRGHYDFSSFNNIGQLKFLGNWRFRQGRGFVIETQDTPIPSDRYGAYRTLTPFRWGFINQAQSRPSFNPEHFKNMGQIHVEGDLDWDIENTLNEQYHDDAISGALNIRATGKVTFAQKGRFLAPVAIEAKSIEMDKDVSFEEEVALHSQIDLITKGKVLIKRGLRFMVGGDWTFLNPVKVLGKAVGKIVGVFRQNAPLEAEEEIDILTGNYEKRAPLQSPKEVRLQVQDRTILENSFEKGMLIAQGPIFLKGAASLEQGFINNGILHGTAIEIFSALVKNNGQLQSKILYFSTQQGAKKLINRGILDIKEVKLEEEEEVFNTGVIALKRLFLKGGQITSYKGDKPFLEYWNRKGQFVRHPTGMVLATQKIEAFPYYKFVEGYTPDFTQPDAIRPEVLKVYRPFYIVLDEGLLEAPELILQDFGGRFDDSWNPRVFQETGKVHFWPIKAARPLASNIHSRGGTIRTKKLTLQVNYFIMDPHSTTQALPVLEFEEVTQFNVLGARNRGTIKVPKGATAPLVLNFMPKVAGHIFFGHFEHQGELIAPEADVSVLGQAMGRGLFDVKNFFYMPHFQERDRLYGFSLPETGIPYTHLLRYRDIQALVAPDSQRATAEIEAERQRLERERAQREAQIRAEEVSRRQQLESQIAQYNAAIAREVSERDKPIGVGKAGWSWKGHNWDPGGQPIYRNGEQKFGFDYRITEHRKSHFSVSQALGALLDQTQARLTQSAQTSTQSLTTFRTAKNDQVAAIVRQIEGKKAQELDEFRRLLGNTTQFQFTIKANTCRYGTCALDMEGLILAKVQADLSQVIDLRTGADFSQGGVPFVEALSRLAQQVGKRASPGSLVLAQSRSPLVRDILQLFEQAGLSLRAGDILSPEIFIGGARAMLGARTGLWGVTENIHIAAQTLALSAFGSLESHHAKVDSQAVVTAGQMHVGHLQSAAELVVDMGGASQIGHLELEALPYIFRVTGGMHVSAPLLLAARYLVQLMDSAHITVDSQEEETPVVIQAPHVEVAADVKVTGSNPLVINAQSTFAQTAGILEASTIETTGSGTTMLIGGQILADTVATVAAPVVYQAPEHKIEADVVSIEAQIGAAIRGEIEAFEKVHLEVPTFDLRDTNRFKTPLTELFLKKDLTVHMPTTVLSALYVQTEGAIHVTQPLQFEGPTQLVATGSMRNTASIRGKQGLSINLVRDDTLLHNTGTIHDERYLIIDGNVLSEKVIDRMEDGRYIPQFGGEITSGGFLELHGRSHQGILSIVAAPHTWIDYDTYYSSGITEGKELLVADNRRMTVQRAQKHWQETVYTTVESGWGPFSSEKTYEQVVNRVESYPAPISGWVNAGRFVADSQIDVSSIFPGRQSRAEPYMEIFSLHGGSFKLGKGGAHIRTKRHVDTRPNTDNKLAFYTISKGGFMGGYSESGAVVQEHAVPVRIDSEGPVHVYTQGTLSLPGLEIVSTGSGDQGVIDLSARGDIHFPPAKVRVEDVPTLSARKGLIYKTSGFHEEAIASTLHGTRVTIHSHEGQVTGARPQVVSLNTDRIVAGGLSEDQAGDRVSFAPVLLYSSQSSQVVGTMGDGNVAMLASLAATVATWGAAAPLAGAMGITSGVGSAMVSAGVSSLIGQTASSLVMNGGNLGDALSSLASTDSLRSLGASIATAGLGAELGGALGIPLEPNTLFEYAQQGAFRSAMGFAVNTTIMGQDVGDALHSGARGFVANTVGGYAARMTGQAHFGGKIDSVAQLGLHAGIGGLMGEILNGDWKSGAVGAVVAEGMAKVIGADPRAAAARLVREGQAQGLSYDQIYALQQLELQRTAAISQFTGAVAAYALGQDPGMAAITGLNAVENNYAGERNTALAQEYAAHHGAGLGERDPRVEHEDDLPDETSFSGMTRESQKAGLGPVDEELAAIFGGERTAPRESHTQLAIRHALEQPPEGHWTRRPPTPPLGGETLRGWAEGLQEKYPTVRRAVEAAGAVTQAIGTEVEWFTDQRSQAYEWKDQFRVEPSWDTWSAAEALKVAGFDMWERSDAYKGLKAMEMLGTALDYGKAYGRRGLRAMGVPAPLAQDVMDVAEWGSMLMGGVTAAEKAAAHVGGKVLTASGRRVNFSLVPGKMSLQEAHLIQQEEAALRQATRALLTDAGPSGFARSVSESARTIPTFDLNRSALQSIVEEQSIAIEQLQISRPFGSHKDLLKANHTDSHHIIQDAAMREIIGYSRKDAPAVQLFGPSPRVGTEHYAATLVQRQSGGGTYGAERRIGYKALRKAGLGKEEARFHIERADVYFSQFNVTKTTSTRIPANRKVPQQ